jgi:hypothetical protein
MTALKGPYPDESPFGSIGTTGSPLAYSIDPGAGSGSDRVTRYWPDRRTLDDIHERGGDITPLYARTADEDTLRDALRVAKMLYDIGFNGPRHGGIPTITGDLMCSGSDIIHHLLGIETITDRMKARWG